MLLPFGGSRNLAFGLEWRGLSGFEGEDKEIALLAKEVNATRQVVVHGKSVICGFHSGQMQRGMQAYSAAVLFQESVKAVDALLLQKVDGAPYVLIAIRDGVPAPGMDLVGSKAALVEKARDYIQNAGERGIIVYGDSDDIFPDTQSFDIEAVSLPETSKSLLVKPKKSMGIISLSAIAVAIVVAYMVYDNYEAGQEAKHRPKQVDPAVAYGQSLENALSQVGLPARITASVYHRAVGGVPAVHEGWILKKIDCAKNCVVTLGRDGGTNRSFLLGGVDPSKVEFSGDGMSIMQTLYLKFPPGRIDKKRFPMDRDFLLNTGSAFQQMSMAGITSNLGTISPFGVTPGGSMPKGFKAVYRGTWTLSGPYGLMDDAFKRLDGNMTLEGLTITQSGGDILGVRFKAEGYFYVWK